MLLLWANRQRRAWMVVAGSPYVDKIVKLGNLRRATLEVIDFVPMNPDSLIVLRSTVTQAAFPN